MTSFCVNLAVCRSIFCSRRIKRRNLGTSSTTRRPNFLSSSFRPWNFSFSPTIINICKAVSFKGLNWQTDLCSRYLILRILPVKNTLSLTSLTRKLTRATRSALKLVLLLLRSLSSSRDIFTLSLPHCWLIIAMSCRFWQIFHLRASIIRQMCIKIPQLSTKMWLILLVF